MTARATVFKSFAALVLAGAMTAAASPPRLFGEPYSVDFGFVGIEFKVFHNFLLINNTSRSVKLKSIHVPCDCSSATLPDSLIRPGDTMKIRLTFDTKDMFGKTSKVFSVYTDDPEMKEVQYLYRATVGQWLQGLRPDPISLFYLPTQKAKKLSVLNQLFDHVRVSAIDQADTLYSIKVVRSEASKNESIQLEVTASPTIYAGTYLSSFRIHIITPDISNPVILSIPVKIVRY